MLIFKSCPVLSTPKACQCSESVRKPKTKYKKPKTKTYWAVRAHTTPLAAQTGTTDPPGPADTQLTPIMKTPRPPGVVMALVAPAVGLEAGFMGQLALVGVVMEVVVVQGAVPCMGAGQMVGLTPLASIGKLILMGFCAV